MLKKLDFMSFGAWLTNGWYYVRFYFLAYLTRYFKHPPTNDINKNDFELVFNDEFDVPPINWEIWSPCEHWGCIRMPDNPKLIYKPEQVKVENGCAVMTSELNQPTEPIYTEFENATPEPLVKSGEVTTWKSLNTLHGFFEVRVKLPPDGLNNWPAFWAYPTTAWPPEIDVFELMGKNSSYVTMTLHYEKDGVRSSRPRRLKFPSKDFLAKDFHTYAVYWNATKIVWYIDNKAVYVLDKHLPTLPMYWLITNGVTDKYTTPPTTLPSVVLCDYFRAYKEI